MHTHVQLLMLLMTGEQNRRLSCIIRSARHQTDGESVPPAVIVLLMCLEIRCVKDRLVEEKGGHRLILSFNNMCSQTRSTRSEMCLSIQGNDCQNQTLVTPHPRCLMHRLAIFAYDDYSLLYIRLYSPSFLVPETHLLERF